MNGMTPIIVKRGFLSTLVSGVSGVIITVAVCGSGLGIYALNVVDRKVDRAVSIGRDVLEVLPKLTESLPPLLSDTLNDRRDPSYRGKLEVSARLAPRSGRSERDSDRREDARVVLTVRNSGPDTVTLLALRVSLVDAGGVPVCDFIRYAATPIAADRDLPGPLLPGNSERVLAMDACTHERVESVQVEVTDVRVWRPQDQTPTATGPESPKEASATPGT